MGRGINGGGPPSIIYDIINIKEAMLTLTPAAAEKLKSFLEVEPSAKGKNLRISLQPSGCAGFEYRLGFDDKKPDDAVLPQAGFDVVIDKESLSKIENATIDYSNDGMGSGFKISNPAEKSSCGCGKSKQF
jgi:iron-sulfur cluster assembly accessory protein